MELFVKPLIIITKSSILYVVAVLDPPLEVCQTFLSYFWNRSICIVNAIRKFLQTH